MKPSWLALPCEAIGKSNSVFKVAVCLFALLLTEISFASPFSGREFTSSSKSEAKRSNLAFAGLEGLPSAAQATVSAGLGRDSSAYQASVQNGEIRLANRSQGLTASFSSDGVAFRTGGAVWGVALVGYGYGDFILHVRTVRPNASLNRVEYRHNVLTEWYLNGPLGLEQGFTVKRRPAASQSQPLNILLKLSGDLTPTPVTGGMGFTLRDREGRSVLQYSGLRAYDAVGKELRARLEVRERTLFLEVDDRQATYPVVIDPWIQVAKLSASDGRIADQFGFSVAADGNTVVVGTYTCCSGSAAYVFVKPNTGWTTTSSFTAKLTASTGPAQDWFGYAVAISGNTIVVGAPLATVGQNGSQGTAYVYVKPETGWRDMTETAKLVASNGERDDQLGGSVAIDGNTVVAGATRATVDTHIYQGAAYVFTKPDDGWNNTVFQKAELSASDPASYEFGVSVSISGTTAVVGANFSPNGGNCYVYVMPQGGWNDMTETAVLTSSQVTFLFASSVSINGNTVAVGTPGDSTGGQYFQGAVYIFVKPPSGWVNMTETAELTASDGALGDSFGSSVALENNILVTGSVAATIGSNSVQGAAYVFIKPLNGWRTTSTFYAKLVAADGHANDQFGHSVAITGNTILSGAPEAAVGSNYAQGASYLFLARAASVRGYNNAKNGEVVIHPH